jgi:hypothetical protein
LFAERGFTECVGRANRRTGWRHYPHLLPVLPNQDDVLGLFPRRVSRASASGPGARTRGWVTRASARALAGARLEALSAPGELRQRENP